MNYMKQVAEMLGVELGEEFHIKEVASGEVVKNEYRITENTLECHYPDGWNVSTIGNAWGKFFTGELKIVKKPWKPKYDEGYYFINMTSASVFDDIWADHAADVLRWKLGNVFRTREEAEANIDNFKEYMHKDPDTSWRRE